MKFLLKILILFFLVCVDCYANSLACSPTNKENIYVDELISRYNNGWFKKNVLEVSLEREKIKPWAIWFVVERLVALSYYSACISNDAMASELILEKYYFIVYMYREKIGWTDYGGDDNANRMIFYGLTEIYYWLSRVDGLKGRINYPDKIFRDRYNIYAKNKINMGNYPNQDIVDALILLSGGGYFDEYEYISESTYVIKSIFERVDQRKRLGYIGMDNDTPHYHGITMSLIGRYYILSGNMTAKNLLTSDLYWPEVMNNFGEVEYWSSPWWKQFWIDIPASFLSLARNFNKYNGSAEIEKILSKKINHLDQDFGLYEINAILTKSLIADDFFKKHSALINPRVDIKIDGIRSKFGNVNFGFSGNQEKSNTFFGALIDKNQETDSLKAIFGIRYNVIRNGDSFNLGKINKVSSKIINKNSGVFCVEYNLINNQGDPWGGVENNLINVIGQQFWYFDDDGIYGYFAINPSKGDKVFFEIDSVGINIDEIGNIGFGEYRALSFSMGDSTGVEYWKKDGMKGFGKLISWDRSKFLLSSDEVFEVFVNFGADEFFKNKKNLSYIKNLCSKEFFH
jgi:hypothetical protein